MAITERPRPTARAIQFGKEKIHALQARIPERVLLNLAEGKDVLRSAARNVKKGAVELFAEKPFVPLYPPLTYEMMLQREAQTMDAAPPHGNWLEDHTMPSPDGHYAHRWKWDSKDAVKINTSRALNAHSEGNYEERDRLLRKATTEFKAILSSEDPDTGFIPNMSYDTPSGRGWRDVEARTFPRPDIGSAYGQPPVLAGAAWDLYEAFERTGQEDKGFEFLTEVYGAKNEGNYRGLQGEFAFWAEQRQNSPTNPLLFVIHPHETGRDSDPAIKPGAFAFLGDGKITGLVNSLIDYGGILKKGLELRKHASDPEGKRVDWLPNKAREKYAVNDVMFNVLYVQNLRYMGKIAEKLGKIGDAEDHRGLARDVEEQILTRMWNPNKKFFYNLDKDGKQIPFASISGLFPLLLVGDSPDEGISQEQLEALLTKREDPRWFNTPYPIPSLPVEENPYFDGDYRMKSRLWRGTVWANANHYIGDEGLPAQAERFMGNNPNLAWRCLDNAEDIVNATQRMLAINPHTNEFYNSYTGQGYRIDGFMWTNLGLHFDKFEKVYGKFDPSYAGQKKERAMVA